MSHEKQGEKMSFLVASLKPKEEIYTFKNNDFPENIQDFQVDDSKGLSLARNLLAEKAETNVLIFGDDDIKIADSLWGKIEDPLPLQKIYMYQGGNHPVSRLLIIRKETFAFLGGFDENIKYNGEDFDLYLRALDAGLFVSIIPSGYVLHKPHSKRNWARYHFESPYVRIKHRKCGVNFFIYRNPLVMLLRITGFIYYRFVKGITPDYPTKGIWKSEGMDVVY